MIWDAWTIWGLVVTSALVPGSYNLGAAPHDGLIVEWEGE